jgi:hypothetical protein
MNIEYDIANKGMKPKLHDFALSMGENKTLKTYM